MFQNALDQQTTIEGNEMFFNYNETEQTLYIGNKSSVLNVNTLLLGSSTKRDDPSTIGQFGEGYKIATLVLTRFGKKVVFYNYGAKEVWLPRFVKARRYNGSEILTFFIDGKFFWQSVPDNNLTITIEGITPDEYQEIIESNLHCQDVGKVTESQLGRILHEEKHKGKVFVNGLFVCNYPKYEYGYDFKPQHIKIDRDRKLADSFELEWLSSKMWGGVDERETIDLVKQGAADVAYITSASDTIFNKNYKTIADKSLEEFKKDHGENAIPVTSQEEYEKVNNGYKYKPVFVSQTYGSIIKSSDKYEPPQAVETSEKSIKSKLEDWLKAHNQSLSKKAKRELTQIIDEAME